MSKIKKLLIGIIVTMIAIIGFTSISQAAYTVGQNVTITYSNYLNDPNLFCVEHH